MRKFAHIITKKIDDSGSLDFWFGMTDFKKGVLLNQIRVTMKDGSIHEMPQQRVETSQSDWLQKKTKHFSVTVPSGDSVDKIEMRCKYGIYSGWTAWFDVPKATVVIPETLEVIERPIEDITAIDEKKFSEIVHSEAQKLINSSKQ